MQNICIEDLLSPGLNISAHHMFITTTSLFDTIRHSYFASKSLISSWQLYSICCATEHKGNSSTFLPVKFLLKTQKPLCAQLTVPSHCRQYSTPSATRYYQLPKPKYLGYLWIAVDDRLVLYLARAVRVPQRAERFLGVWVGRADTSYHQCVAVATERVYTHIHFMLPARWMWNSLPKHLHDHANSVFGRVLLGMAIMCKYHVVHKIRPTCVVVLQEKNREWHR